MRRHHSVRLPRVVRRDCETVFRPTQRNTVTTSEHEYTERRFSTVDKSIFEHVNGHFDCANRIRSVSDTRGERFRNKLRKNALDKRIGTRKNTRLRISCPYAGRGGAVQSLREKKILVLRFYRLFHISWLGARESNLTNTFLSHRPESENASQSYT